VYLEYQGELIDNLYLTAGVRHDDNEDFGAHTSLRLSSAYVWTLDQGEVKLRSAYGTGFRAPSLSEIDYNRGPFSYPPASNVELQVEQTKGYEVALEYVSKNGSAIEVVYFDQEIKDSIEFDLAGFSGYLQDFGDSFSEGVELIGQIKVTHNLMLHGNYTYNDSQDTTGEQRVRRPRNMANVGFDYQFEKFSVSANVRFVRDFVDVVFDDTTFENVRVALDDYHVVDLSVRYRVNSQFSVFARVENLFDKQYQDLANFYTAADTPYIGVNYQF
jgi:vitamin B12 transporter